MLSKRDAMSLILGTATAAKSGIKFQLSRENYFSRNKFQEEKSKKGRIIHVEKPATPLPLINKR